MDVLRRVVPLADIPWFLCSPVSCGLCDSNPDLAPSQPLSVAPVLAEILEPEAFVLLPGLEMPFASPPETMTAIPPSLAIELPDESIEVPDESIEFPASPCFLTSNRDLILIMPSGSGSTLDLRGMDGRLVRVALFAQEGNGNPGASSGSVHSESKEPACPRYRSKMEGWSLLWASDPPCKTLLE